MTTATATRPAKAKGDLPKLEIDPEFRDFLPPLSPEEDAALEKSIKELGRATDPICVWGDTEIILDGYNRYDKCKRLKADYTIRRIEGLEDRAACLQWIFERQDARRNWDDKSRGMAMGTLYRLKQAALEEANELAKKDEKAAKKAEKADKEDFAPGESPAATNGHAEGTPAEVAAPEREAAEQVAEQFGVGVATVRRHGKTDEYLNVIAEKAGDEIRQAFRGVQISFTGKGVQRLASLPAAKVKTIASKLLKAVADGEKPALIPVMEAVAGPPQAVRGKTSKPSAKKGRGRPAGVSSKEPFARLDKSIEAVCRNVDEIARLQGKTNHSKGLLEKLAAVKKAVGDWKRAKIEIAK